MIKKIIKLLKLYLFKISGGVMHLSINQIEYPSVYKGKRILITGGSEGIGCAMARKFVKHGASVVITGRNVEKLKAAQKKIGSNNIHILTWDISDLSIMKEKFEEVVNLLGCLDILINNAAFLSNNKTMDDMEFFDKTINTNLKAVYMMCNFAVGHFLAKNGQEGGKILNISSVNSFQGGTSPYFISKRGVNSITEGLAKSYGHKNIIVNGIAPGFTASSINYQDVSKNAYDDRTINHRIITPEEIAELAFFLCSGAANGIMGQTIVCDGGFLLK